jgi:hypothetical protein
MITTFQNSKSNSNGMEAVERKAANGVHEATSRGGRTIISPLTPLQARLNAAVQKPAQVGYRVPVNGSSFDSLQICLLLMSCLDDAEL